MPVVLAIDYGTKRIGIAISKAGFAIPVTVLANTAEIFTEIKQIVEREAVEKIVIGLSEQQMAKKTEQFAKELADEIDVPIVFIDETLSSQTVRKKLQSSKKKVRSGPIDHFAAAEFLQEWLDLQ